MRRVLKHLAATVALLLVALVVYGVAIEPRFRLDERRGSAVIPGLPDALDGTRVAVFSDLQVGMWLANLGMVERIVERAVEVQPDAVMLAGDFVYGSSPDPRAQVRTVVDLLDPLLASGIPVYAVLGNHDHESDAAEGVVAALEERGATVLENQAVSLPLGERSEPPLYVVGIGSHRAGRSHPARALGEVPPGAPRIVMMHNPASFTAIGASEAPLAVAGHTHCGQIAVPGTPAWSYLELRRDERAVVDGFAPAHHGAAGNRLFVNCGIGFSLAPLRIFAPPQLVIFELTTG